MTKAARGYAQFVQIQRPPARVFSAFTSKEQLETWYAAEASVEPRRGGALRVRLKDGRTRDALIDVFDQDRRLRLIYMPDAAMPPMPPAGGGPIIEDVLFDPKGDSTMVRVLGSGVPGEHEWDPYFAWLRSGWTYWLHTLKLTLRATRPPVART
ncbi:MAG TPA: SRPBCC domain-containing protein [Steroidobacteraceae bacterium]|nr:SRPBCC domain-containing protein [Steroidobacteraceae bacterium]